MTGGIEQIHIAYVPRHDRLLMRVSTSGQVEIRLWLTRRLVQMLWPLLLKVLETDPDVTLQSDPRAREEVMSFQHQQAVSETKFTKQFQPPPQARPLSEVPLLITRVGASPGDGGQTRLAFVTERGRSIQLGVGRRLAHSLCKLIADCEQGAEWGLDLKLAGTLAEAAPADDSPRTIN